MLYNFIKMNGTGNDFVVIDGRNQLSIVNCRLSEEQIKALCNRNNTTTKGCDQLLVLEPSTKADVFMRIYGVDGIEVDACGNATRCIASLLEKELRRLPITIETNAGILNGVKKEIVEEKQYILVDMGIPKFGWQDIPLAMPIDEAAKKINTFHGLKNPVFINMGNPHVVFFVKKLPTDDEVAKIGLQIEHYTEVFPERVNVSFAVIDKDFVIHAKVWERSAGLTEACGTGACAMLAAANKIDTRIKNAFVWFENSMQSVSVSLEKNGHILLGGAVQIEFEGTVEI